MSCGVVSHDHNIASHWRRMSPRRSRHDIDYSALDRNRYKEGRFGIVLDVSMSAGKYNSLLSQQTSHLVQSLTTLLVLWRPRLWKRWPTLSVVSSPVGNYLDVFKAGAGSFPGCRLMSSLRLGKCISSIICPEDNLFYLEVVKTRNILRTKGK